MKTMKKMMERMIPVMMKGISSKEKEDMMLKMMPMIMKEIDMAEMMPKMMSAMLPELLPQFFDMMNNKDIGQMLLDKMSMIMPNVCEVINKEVLAQKKDIMVSNLMQRETFKERMPKCFADGMPKMVKGCFEHFMPELSKEERKAFMSSIIRPMLENGTKDFTQEEKEELLKI